MNIHGVTSGLAGIIHPSIVVQVKRSTGYVLGADHKQVPQYRLLTTTARIQALTAPDIERMNMLGFQGVMRAAYLGGRFNAMVRKDGKGGDLFQFDGQTWLAVHVLESWGVAGDPTSWTKLALQLQTDPPQ